MFLDKMRSAVVKTKNSGRVKPTPLPRKAEVRHVYPVAVVENASTQACGLAGLYELSVNVTDLAIHNITTHQLLLTFPYRYIRRYGRTSRNFQFEAGRRCDSGAGLFSLIVEDGLGEEIFSLVKCRFEQIKRQSSLPSPSSSQSSSRNNSSSSSSLGYDSDSDYEGNNPDLPPRNYRADTLRSLFARKKSAGSIKTQSTSSESESKSNSGSLKRKPKSPTPKRIQPRTYYEEINIDNEESFSTLTSGRRSRPSSPTKQSHYSHTQAHKSPSSPRKQSHYSQSQPQRIPTASAVQQPSTREPLYASRTLVPRSPPTTSRQPHHPQATKSPSYLNSLIRKHKMPLTESMSSSSGDISMDSLYHVLCEYGAKPHTHRCTGGCRHPIQNYSHIQYPQASRR